MPFVRYMVIYAGAHRQLIGVHKFYSQLNNTALDSPMDYCTHKQRLKEQLQKLNMYNNNNNNLERKNSFCFWIFTYDHVHIHIHAY